MPDVQWVELGNDKCIEGYRDAQSDDPELVRWRSAPGERITRFEFPQGTTLTEQLQYVVSGLQFHFEEHEIEDENHPEGVRTVRHSPVWIESNNPTLKTLLIEQFGLTAHRANRTKTWGKEFGLHKDPNLSFSHPANDGHTGTSDAAVKAHREGAAAAEDDDEQEGADQ